MLWSRGRRKVGGRVQIDGGHLHGQAGAALVRPSYGSSKTREASAIHVQGKYCFAEVRSRLYPNRTSRRELLHSSHGTYLRCKSSDAVFVAGPHPAGTAGTTDGRPREGRNTIEQRQARVMWGGSRGKWGLIPHCQRADARAHIPARVRPSSCRKEKKIPTRGILNPPPVHHQGEDLNTSGHIRCYRYREMLIREDHLCDNAASG